jgi:hypothetical protein
VKEVDRNNRNSYKIDLEKSLQDLMDRKPVDAKTVEYLIPRSQKEWKEYYSFTKKGPGFNKAFYQLDNLIGKYASLNYLKTLKLYLEMSPFVDGEYAEGYFDDADFIIGKQKKEFCRIYPDLSKKTKYLFEGSYKNYCK